jgi:Arc/MetJ family transcription regulator
MCKTDCGKEVLMPTNLALDDKLINEARRLGKHKTKKEAVTVALEEYIKRHKRLRILDLFGKIDYDPRYDYKRARWRKYR